MRLTKHDLSLPYAFIKVPYTISNLIKHCIEMPFFSMLSASTPCHSLVKSFDSYIFYTQLTFLRANAHQCVDLHFTTAVKRRLTKGQQ